MAKTEGEAANEKNVVYLLRQDLRLHDNRALLGAIKEASQRGGRVACAFVWSEQEEGTTATWGAGGATRVWLHHALESLDSELRMKHGSGIVFASGGDRFSTLMDLSQKLGAASVHWSKRYEPAQTAADQALLAKLKEAGISCREWSGFLLREPDRIAYDMSRFVGHFGTLTPFSAACDKFGQPERAAAAPQSSTLRALVMAPPEGVGVPLSALGLNRMPVDKQGKPVDWAAPIRTAWGFGEADALELLDSFVAHGFEKYEGQRHLADGRAVSRLSPYLHFGMISPRLIQEKIEAAGGKKVSKTFARRLVWRDLAYWQLHQWPTLPHSGLREQLSTRPWAQGAEAAARLEAWRRGRTGFPLVDAGMRELWATGWMQQSVRMVAASFLVDVLNVPWTEGARWFHDCLVDADLAINSMMWQNCAGTGMDPWNFVLDPGSSYQDPTGEYVARWVPELSKLRKPHIHQPWIAPPAVLAAAGVALGETYPHRIVADVAVARAEADRGVREARAAAPADIRDANGYDMIRAPAGAISAPPALRNGGLIRVFTLPKFRVKGGSAVDPAAAAQEGAASAGGKKGANAAAATKKPRKKSSACAAAGGAKRGGASARAAGGKQQQKRGRISIADSPVVKNKENDREQRELNAYRGADWREVEAMEELWEEEAAAAEAAQQQDNTARRAAGGGSGRSR